MCGWGVQAGGGGLLDRSAVALSYLQPMRIQGHYWIVPYSVHDTMHGISGPQRGISSQASQIEFILRTFASTV